MDEGRLTDSNGSTVDFKNTIIIITSNCGTRQIQDFGRGIGFEDNNNDENRQATNTEIINKALNKQFAPEFINRLDDIIIFEQLNKDSIGDIADLELQKLHERMKQIGYDFKLDKKAREFIINKGYDEKYGARPLKRAIQSYVEDGISDFLLSGKEIKNNLIHITHLKEKNELHFS
jgi:ATP-dependent Clp protease ATP-binding subunit ClpC